MKLKTLLLAGFAFVAFSCSDDDPTPLNKQTISLAGEQQIVTVPTALLESDDPEAQKVAGWIQNANLMVGCLAYANIPSNAAGNSNTKITASNGRTAATGDFYTYIWTEASTGYSVAFQISEEEDAYVFEAFLKIPQLDINDWVKYFHVEEKKDRSSGFMKAYDIFGDGPSEVWFTYSWTWNGDMLTLSMDIFGSKAVMEVNTKTKAGNITYYDGEVVYYEAEWDAQGNGEWTYYDEQGTVTGTWTV